MRAELVAFDCDGVLVDTEPVVNRVFVALVSRSGPELDVDETLSRFTGVSIRCRIEGVRASHGWVPPSTFEAEFDALQHAAIRAEIQAIPGVVSVVRAVRAARAVVSNGTRAEVTMKLAAVGLLDAFSPNLFSAAEVAQSKPAPDVYLHAAKTMGVPVARAVAVEDSLPGARAAVAAGFAVLGYARTTDSAALAALGARPFRTMKELPDLLRQSGLDVRFDG